MSFATFRQNLIDAERNPLLTYLAVTYVGFIVALGLKPTVAQRQMLVPTTVLICLSLLIRTRTATGDAKADEVTAGAACLVLILKMIDLGLCLPEAVPRNLPLFKRWKIALGQAASFRGIGYSWRIKTPPSVHMTKQRYCAWAAMRYVILCFAAVGLIRVSAVLKPRDLSSLKLDGLFSSLISIAAIYNTLERVRMVIDVLTIMFLKGQPEDCAPLFDFRTRNPAGMFTLRNFWGRQWHQLFRRVRLAHPYSWQID